MTGSEHQDDPAQPPGMGTDLPNAGPASAGMAHDGLSWSWEVDLDALLAAAADPAPWQRDPGPPADASQAAPAAPAFDDQDAVLAEYLEAVEAGRSRQMPLEMVAGRIAESLPAGPGLAGWLAAGDSAGLEDGALAGVAASYRRIASWAQAGELAAVAELASRSAAADTRNGVNKDGRPKRLPDDACAEVSLGLVMSQATASWWTDLGITLRWRLKATGTALRAGLIDLGRARAIAEATACLDDEKAREVEAQMLEGAGAKTMGQLRAGLRHAVIKADPDGAERRREQAERQAKVVLYPDAEGTASLAGYNLPGIGAAAAMARITALAQALKASGAGGGIDLLRAQVLLGLLLDTLPHIPPPPGAPPDDGTLPGDSPPDDNIPPDDSPADECPSEDGPPTGGLPGEDLAGGGESLDGSPGEGRGRAPAGSPSSDKDTGSHRGDRGSDRADRDYDRDNRDDERGGPSRQRDNPDSRDDPGQHGEPDDQRGSRGSQRKHGDQRDRNDDDHGDQCDDWGDQVARPPPAWPPVPPLLQPGPAMGNLAPATGGLLDLRLPWGTLTGRSPEPGHLGRLGPITATQARYLAGVAARDPSVRWRVIVTDPDGRAEAVTHLTRPKSPDRHAGLIGQVTVIIARDSLTDPHQADNLPPIMVRILAAARTAADQAAAGGHADGGCTHADATDAYRPTRKLWEYVTARDLTCRFRTCRQPATRGDLDHTTPFDQGGRTCSCNLGGICRFHHQIKGRPRWHLHQATPGAFTWTTPTGRSYHVRPDSYTA